MDFDSLFEEFKKIKVGVVGDVMLDTYWWGKVDRVSPEAPVPIVSVTKREKRIGGAANVALNLNSLGVAVNVLSVLGKDEEGDQLIYLLNQNQISTDYLTRSNHRITTNKIRIIGRNQQMMRLDAEMTEFIKAEDEIHFISNCKKYIENENPDIIILEDYNKGVLSETVIKEVMLVCKEKNIPVAVDPKRKNFFSYAGATIFKPNFNEAREALNILDDSISMNSLNNIHDALHQKLHHTISFITLSEKGVYFNSSKNKMLIPTHIRNIADVSGAGDTVIAVASVVFSATKSEQLMAEMANIAGGLVCEEVGTAAINKDKLLEECKRLLHS
jgi:rfaE bifunctional protein kinase chain/domain